jgi:methanogen homocitrate synthase
MEEVEQFRTRPSEVVIHDTTLRDGEQAPGVAFNVDDKIEIAEALNAVGIQYIEAGFPVVSEQDKQAIIAISSLGLNSRITCLSRCMKSDIELAAECGVWGIVLEVPVGYPRLKYQFEWPEEKVINLITDSIRIAYEEFSLKVILFLIDTARARLEFLKTVITEASSSGLVERIALVDTVGGIVPDAMAGIVRLARSWSNVPFEIHCHNDLGLAVSNTVAGIMAGAQIASTTVGGLGQRAGNAATEAVIMALNLGFGINCKFDLSKLQKLAEIVQKKSGYSFPGYQPIVGKQIFQWSSGIPVAALFKEPLTVEPFIPRILDRVHEIEVGKKAGKANLIWKIDELGLDGLKDDQLESLLKDVKRKAIDDGKSLSDDDFVQLYNTIF